MKDVDRLAADLRSSDSVRRDAAVARLRIMGGRSVARLASVIASDAPARVRALALNALDGIEDVRTVDAALEALPDANPDVVIAALGVLRNWVTSEVGTRLLDAISGIAVDRTRDDRVRVAALAALSDLPEHLVRPIRDQVPPPESAAPAVDDPAAVREWIQTHGAKATLSALHELVKRTRERAQSESSVRLRTEWLRARGSAHAALARRRSVVALYDIRETLEAATGPLPPEFLSAAAAIGDASCLEPLARAWSGSPKDVTWRHELTATAATIMKRARLTGRSAAVKRLRAHWPGFV